MNAILFLGRFKMGQQNLRQYFTVIQNAGEQNIRMNKSIILPRNSTLDDFHNFPIKIVFRRIMKRDIRNTRCG
jgi:hypothetical protein